MKSIACYIESGTNPKKILTQMEEIESWAKKQEYPQNQLNFHPFFVDDQNCLSKEEYDGMLEEVRQGKIERIITSNIPYLERHPNWTIMLLTCKNNGVPVELAHSGELTINSKLLSSLRAVL